MNVGTQDRPKLIAAVISMVSALLLSARWFFGHESSVSAALSEPAKGATAIATPTLARQPNSLDPTLHYAQLELTENQRYDGSGRNIFQSDSEETPPGEMPPEPPPRPSHRLVQPAASSIGLKFFGLATISHSEPKACFTQDGNVFIGSEGDTIERRYRIVHIGTNAVDLEDLIEHRPHTLTLEW